MKEKISIQEKMAKNIYKELTKLRSKLIKNMDKEEKYFASVKESWEKLENKKPFLNPKYALKQLDKMIFSFEYILRYTDKDWVRIRLLREAYTKEGFTIDEAMRHPQRWQIHDKVAIPIETKLQRKYNIGMKLFTKHFQDFTVLEYYS